jgi:GAF domain-containing protein
MDFVDVLIKAEGILAKPSSASARLRALCYLLRHNVDRYDWVGFYLVDPARPTELRLGPFEGEEEHPVTIRHREGAAGTAAATGKLVIAQDPADDPGAALSPRSPTSSPGLASALALPVHVGGSLVAVMEIGSRVHRAFTREDQLFLDRVCEVVAAVLREDGGHVRNPAW